MLAQLETNKKFNIGDLHTANEGPVRIQYKCPVPIYVLNCYFQNRITMFCLPVPTLIYLWEIYIFPGLFHLICRKKIRGPILGIYLNCSKTHKCGNLDWGRAIPRKGILKSDFHCSAVANGLAATSDVVCIRPMVHRRRTHTGILLLLPGLWLIWRFEDI